MRVIDKINVFGVVTLGAIGLTAVLLGFDGGVAQCCIVGITAVLVKDSKKD